MGDFADGCSADWAAAARPTSCTRTSGCPGWPPSMPAAAAAGQSRWCRPSTRWARSSAGTRATRTPARSSAPGWSRAVRPRRRPRSSPPAPTRCSSCAGHGHAHAQRVSIVPCGVDLRRLPPRRPGRDARPTTGICHARPAGGAQGHRPGDTGPPALSDQGSTTSSSWWWAAAGAAGLADDPEAQPAARPWPANSGVEDRLVLRGQLSPAGSRRCCAAPTPWSAPLVRAVRHRAAGSDGLRRAGGRRRRRRAARHRGGPEDRPARPAPRSAAIADAVADLLADPQAAPGARQGRAFRTASTMRSSRSW